jgi:hypothetical protein
MESTRRSRNWQGARRAWMRHAGALALGMASTGLFRAGVVSACSVCGGTAAGTDPGAGFHASLLFMMAMPYLVIGVIAGWLIYKSRRPVGNRQESGSASELLWRRRETES